MTLIIEKEGNLLEAEENLILHQVNCQSKMNSGVAKQIRDKWTNVYEAYKKFCNTDLATELLGQAQYVPIEDGQMVVNLFGQLKYGYDGERYTNYEGLYSALEKTARYARKYDLSVALPKHMGCDRGGANWNIVYTMIEEAFKNHTKPIVIYKLKGENNFTDKDSLELLKGE